MIYPEILSSAYINNTFAPLDSAVLVGTPTAPTADVNSPGSNQLATTNYVKNSISALVASAPTTLDTLNELAAALGNDPNFATTVTSSLGNKVDTNSANYLKSVSISNDNKTITFTKGNGSTVVITPHDTTYTAGSRITITGTTITANDQLPSRSNNAGKILRVSSNNSSVEWSDERPTSLVSGGSSATTNSTSDVSNPYLNTIENSTKVGSVQFVGSGATTIKAKNGIITISSTDNDTKYSHPSYTARTGNPTTNLTPKFGDTITISQIVSNGTGHVTAANDKTIKIPADGPTTTLKGLMPALKNDSTLYLRSDGNWVKPPNDNTTYSLASTSSDGLLRKLSTDTSLYLRADGTWKKPPNDNTTYSAGTDLSLSTTTFNHKNSGVTANTYGPSANVDAYIYKTTTISVPYFTVNARGHITAAGNRTLRITANASYCTYTCAYSCNECDRCDPCGNNDGMG